MKEAANEGRLTQAGFARFSISSIAAEYMAANSLSHFALAGLSGLSFANRRHSSALSRQWEVSADAGSNLNAD
jgi:hypothetical protein